MALLGLVMAPGDGHAANPVPARGGHWTAADNSVLPWVGNSQSTWNIVSNVCVSDDNVTCSFVGGGTYDFTTCATGTMTGTLSWDYGYPNQVWPPPSPAPLPGPVGTAEAALSPYVAPSQLQWTQDSVVMEMFGPIVIGTGTTSEGASLGVVAIDFPRAVAPPSTSTCMSGMDYAAASLGN